LAGQAPFGTAHERRDGARRVLEGLALEESREQEIALFEPEEFLVKLEIGRSGQEATGLELDQCRSDEEKLGSDFEIELAEPLQLNEIPVDDGREGDLPEVDFLLEDQVQQQVERTREYGGGDLVAHQDRGYRPQLREPGQVPCRLMARVFSGIQPTGDMHLGNYLGAVRQWVADQGTHDAIYCVVDLHAMTTPYDAAMLAERTRRTATLLLAAGLDPDRCTLFVQSHVPAHTGLMWILNCVATVGELLRMTQFKEKGQGQESVSAGLFDYPVLMAADILAYDTDRVPVGDDQRQHLELARDLALRFNHRYGDTLVVPEAAIPPVGARVMDLQKPTAKMSKSADSPQGTIALLDEPKAIEKRLKSAVTDSDTEIRFDPEHKPGVANLLQILASTTGREIPELEHEFAGQGYGTLKAATADAVAAFLEPLRARYEELDARPEQVTALLALGAEKAEAIATKVLARVRDAVGLLPRG